MSFSIKIEGIPELMAKTRVGYEELVQDVRQGAAHAAQVATRQMKADCPVGDGRRRSSGTMRNSINPTLRPTRSGATGAITVKDPFAQLVVEGSKPHPIPPKSRGGRLIFPWKKLGGMFIGRPNQAVNHPGTKPNDFVTPGVEIGQNILEHDAAVAVAKFERKIEG